MKQADRGPDLSAKRTRKRQFLDEMERVVPWSELTAPIKPHYVKRSSVGRPPFALASMLRIHFLQHSGSRWRTCGWRGASCWLWRRETAQCAASEACGDENYVADAVSRAVIDERNRSPSLHDHFSGALDGLLRPSLSRRRS